MQKLRKPIVAIALAMVASLSVGSVALAESASGSGATFPQQFMASATVAFNTATGHNVSYANPGGGSTKGKSDFKAGLTDFGGSDSAVTSTQAAAFDWVYVPYVAGAISIAYRLDEIKGTTLSLSPATINGIFGGTITKWNDPSIANDMKTNPAWANSLKKSGLKGATSVWSTPSLNTALVTVTLVPSVLKSSKGKTVELYDNTKKKYVPLELFPDQISLLNDYEEYEENIALKYRQAGVSTVTAAWASKRLAFAKKNKPEKILIIANKLDTSLEMANKVKAFIGQWPKWVGVDFSAEKNSQKHYKLNNGSEVKAVATSKDALRGFTPTILIFDEAAFIEADSDFWAACMASLSTGGKVIVVSTPNGYDPIYYEIYDQALRNMNDFKISEMFWFRDPRYAKDLYLVKTDDIIHYLLNKEEYNEKEIISWESKPFDERNYDELKELMNHLMLLVYFM